VLSAIYSNIPVRFEKVTDIIIINFTYYIANKYVALKIRKIDSGSLLIKTLLKLGSDLTITSDFCELREQKPYSI